MSVSSLGIRFLLFFAFSAPLYGGDYRYTLSLDRHEAWVKAPILLRFSVEQTDPSKVMFFDFKPLEEKCFKAVRLDKTVDDSYHRRKERYTYLIFGLKAGTAKLRFDLLVKRTNEATIEQSTTGGRYNVKDIETVDTHEAVTPEKIILKPLPEPVDLVGDFTLEAKVDRTEVKAGRPIYLTIHLKGTGFPPESRRIDLHLEGVDIFEDKPLVSLRYTKKGAICEATYTYALKAVKNFSIPSIHLKAFSTTQGKLYTLMTKKIDIHVLPAGNRHAQNLMKPERERKIRVSWLGRVKDAFLYIGLFLIGYISGHMWLKGRGAR